MYNDTLTEPFSRGDFYLIQRMAQRKDTSRGIDGSFKLSYMGSAEFEWGAIPKAIIAYNALAEESQLIQHEITTVLNQPKVTPGLMLAYSRERNPVEITFQVLVKSDVTKDQVQAVMDGLEKMRLKESLLLDYSNSEMYDYADTWMCLTSPFVFSRNKEGLRLFLDGINFTADLLKETK